MFIDPKKLFQTAQDTIGNIDVEQIVDSVKEDLSAAASALGSPDEIQAGGSQNMAGVAQFSTGAEDAPVDMGYAFWETAGAVVSDVAQATETAMDQALGDLQNDGTVNTYSPEGKRVDDGDANIFVVNGVDMNAKSREKMAIDTAVMYGENVSIVNNASGGILVDGAEYLLETFFSVPSPATQTMSDQLYEKLTSEPPEKVKIMAYSQGSTQTGHALSLTIARLKEDGMTDEQIRDLMRENVDVTMIGTPLDMDNPAQTMLNVPPGIGIGQKRLDWYFTTEDVWLQGGNPPNSRTVKREGTGEPNFKMIRHEKDPIATWVRGLNPYDAVVAAELAVLGPFMVIDPAGCLYLGSRVASIAGQVAVNQMEEGDFAGYHDYLDYYNYMQNGLNPYGGVPTAQEGSRANKVQELNEKKASKPYPPS